MKIKVYLINTNKIDIDNLLNSPFISEEDKMSFLNFTNETIRKEKVASQYLKRRFVGDYYIDKHGKPLSNNVFFNISHSHGVVVIAINDEYPIGVDIEKARKADQKLINYVCNQTELEYIKTELDFYKIWTTKEALLKAIGTGINTKMKDVPGLFLYQKQEYLNKTFISKTTIFEDYVITLVLETKKDIEINIAVEVIFE